MSTFSIEVNVNIPGLVEAIQSLASAFNNKCTFSVKPILATTVNTSTPEQSVAPVTPVAPAQPVTVPVAPTSAQPIYPQPTPTAAPTAQIVQFPQPAAAPIQQATPAAPTAPTAPAPEYAIDDLARAAAALMDAGKQQQLLALLGQFGVPSLAQLPKEQFGAFATALRQMGARI